MSKKVKVRSLLSVLASIRKRVPPLSSVIEDYRATMKRYIEAHPKSTRARALDFFKQVNKDLALPIFNRVWADRNKL